MIKPRHLETCQLRRATVYSSQAMMLQCAGNALLEQKPNYGMSAPLACLSSRRLTRLTNGFSKKLDCHVAAVNVYVAFYNLYRAHEAPRTTPAVSLGLTDHVWSIGELIDAALAILPPDLGRRHKKPAFTVIDVGKE